MSPPPRQPPSSNPVRAIMRWVIAAFFAAAGVAHLAVPDKLLSITPDWAPFAPTVIFLTGVFEFAAVAALPGGAKLINDAKAFSAQTDAYFGLN
jgi:uncharacterized membrane protein